MCRTSIVAPVSLLAFRCWDTGRKFSSRAVICFPPAEAAIVVLFLSFVGFFFLPFSEAALAPFCLFHRWLFSL